MDVTTFFTILLSIAAPIGGALWPIIRWLEPKLTGVFTRLNTLLERLSQQHDILDRFSSIQAVMADTIASQQSHITKGRWLTLIVDDSAVSRRLLLRICSEIASDLHLTVKDVGSLADAYEHLPFCNLVILDVLMSDCDEARAQAFVSVAPCPVIIYSGADIADNAIIGASATIRKSDSLENLEKAIREALSSRE